jgi:hypothetical protein
MPRLSPRPSTAKSVAGMASSKTDKRLGKCDCGGEVRGVFDFDRWFSWCEKCSPVVKVDVATVFRSLQ